MQLREFAQSKGFFEIAHHIAHPRAGQRLFFVKTFFVLLAALPCVIVYKAGRSSFRATGLLLSASWLGATLGLAGGIRTLFIKRFSSMAADLADWILYPLALATCFARLLLASLVHPALFFRY